MCYGSWSTYQIAWWLSDRLCCDICLQSENKKEEDSRGAKKQMILPWCREKPWKKYCFIKQCGYLKICFDGKAKEKIRMLIGDIPHPVTKCGLQRQYEEIQNGKDYNLNWQVLIDVWEMITVSLLLFQTTIS